jgi:hypothetical protein
LPASRQKGLTAARPFSEAGNRPSAFRAAASANCAIKIVDQHVVYIGRRAVWGLRFAKMFPFNSIPLNRFPHWAFMTIE